jgi:hypothetical protein
MLKTIHTAKDPNNPIARIGRVRKANDLIWTCYQKDKRMTFFQITSSQLIQVETEKKPLLTGEAEKPIQGKWKNEFLEISSFFNTFTGISKNGVLTVGTLSGGASEEQNTTLFSVPLNLSKYNLNKKVQLFRDNYGTFVFFYDMDGM